LNASLDQVDALLAEKRLLAEGLQSSSSQCRQRDAAETTLDYVYNNTKLA
jgi:hypothetical protein